MSLSLAYLDRVEQNSQTNLGLNNNWNSYTSSEFGATFLSQSSIKTAGKLRIHDAAELTGSISSNQINLSSLLGIQDAEFSVFSYIKNSQASLNNDKVIPKGNEFFVFVEVQNDQDASVNFSFGKKIAKQIDTLAEKQDQNSVDIQNKKFTLLISDIKKSFKSRTSEQSVLQFALETMGFETTEVSIANFEKVMDEAFSNIPDVDGVLFDAGFTDDGNKKTWSHGDIEKRAFEDKKIFTKKKERLQIYYGNWLRDYSSVITGNTVGFDKDDRAKLTKDFAKEDAVKEYKYGFFSKPSQDTWIKVIKLLAANEFVYKQGFASNNNILDHVKILSKNYDAPRTNVVGLYRPEEHIDNPKALIDESPLSSYKLDSPVRYTYSKMNSLKNPIKYPTKELYTGESPDSLTITSKMKTYIKNTVDSTRPSSLRYFGEQMRLAKKKGRNKTGFRHFGAALHVLEDFYAHSNFLEVTLIKLKHTKVYPWVDSYIDGTKIEVSNIDPCKIPIVTGYFGQLDIIASLSPKIAKEFFPSTFQNYKALDVGHRTLMDELIFIVLDDYISKEEGMDESDKYSFLSYGYADMKAEYRKFLSILDGIRLLEKNPFVGPTITLYKKAMNVVSQVISFLPNLVISLILNSLDETVQTKQTQAGPVGTDPSHTQLAKDHTDHHFNDLAGYIAYLVVGRVGKEMDECWNGTKNVEDIIDLVDKRYFVHPCDVTWIDSHVEKWADKNSSKVTRGERKTTDEHVKKEFDKYKKKVDDELKRIEKEYS